MMATESVGAVLRDLKTRVGGVAAALVARTGLVLFADLPDGVFAETFAVMCATIVGAATTAHGEMHRASPDCIVVDSPDSSMVIVPSGSRALLVAVVDPSADRVRVLTEMGKFADLLKARGDPAPLGSA